MHPRYLIYLMPVIALLMAAALVRMRNVFLWGPMLIFFTVVNLASVKALYSRPKTDWPDAIRHIESHLLSLFYDILIFEVEPLSSPGCI